ncbi:amidohydrolase family protein, partial [Acetobacter senegalensis]
GRSLPVSSQSLNQISIIKSMGPEPRASVLRAITMNSAYELRQDSVTGSVEQGKIADLIILDRNITTVPVNEIGKTTVLMTMVGGKVVYSSGEFVPKTP